MFPQPGTTIAGSLRAPECQCFFLRPQTEQSLCPSSPAPDCRQTTQICLPLYLVLIAPPPLSSCILANRSVLPEPRLPELCRLAPASGYAQPLSGWLSQSLHTIGTQLVPSSREKPLSACAFFPPAWLPLPSRASLYIHMGWLGFLSGLRSQIKPNTIT